MTAHPAAPYIAEMEAWIASLGGEARRYAEAVVGADFGYLDPPPRGEYAVPDEEADEIERRATEFSCAICLAGSVLESEPDIAPIVAAEGGRILRGKS